MMKEELKQNGTYRKIVEWANMHFPVTVAKMRYRMLFGKPLHLNPPVNLNEKILWLSLYSDTSEWTRLADKHKVREYISEQGFENILVPLYGKWDKAEDIEWNKLPDSFVLKTNHGCGAVWIVEDKSTIDKGEITKSLNDSLSRIYGKDTSERHYTRIKPCVIAEQLLKPSPEDLKMSTSLIDYKIWCMNGRAEYIWVVSNRCPEHFDGTMFDREWNVVPNVVRPDVAHVHIPHTTVKRPDGLEDMIQIAETLSRPFAEVRVDLYYVGRKIYFGELTFTTHGGTIDYMTEEHLMKMGEKIDISKVKKIR